VKIAVLFGGDSMERDVSVASASQVVAALRSRGHEVIAVDAREGALGPSAEAATLGAQIARTPPEQTRTQGLPRGMLAPELSEVDVVFLAMHGTQGEDGTLQALFDLAGIAYTGSGRLGSTLGWDKDVAKHLMRAAGVPTPDWLMAPVSADQAAEQLGFPLIVKPNGQGSTVGLSLVEEPASLAEAIELALRFDSEAMLERYVAGRELTVGILEDRALAVGEIIPVGGPIFDYQAKYQHGGAREIFPAEIDATLTARLQSLALRVHRTLKLASYCRVDFRMDEQGGVWCLEANTLPGLASASLLPQSAAASGIPFDELCERIARAALRRDPHS
jgi:D-alanine-D-alanine ligase